MVYNITVYFYTTKTSTVVDNIISFDQNSV